MNTLSREVTARLFANGAHFEQLRQRWRWLTNSPAHKHALRAEHHLLYAAMTGRDWRRGFRPITNPRKLANGAFPGWKMWHALRFLHFAGRSNIRTQELIDPFDGLITPEMLRTLSTLVPDLAGERFSASDFASGYPFDAYIAPQVSQ